jgi:translation initiation factor 5A
MDSICSVIPIESAQVKIGNTVIIKSRPCKIVDAMHHKTGKHGHAKVNMTGIDVLTSKKYE